MPPLAQLFADARLALSSENGGSSSARQGNDPPLLLRRDTSRSSHDRPVQTRTYAGPDPAPLNSGTIERTLSGSSVSSANSTSSIEAAPFRAPPRGNLRYHWASHLPAPPMACDHESDSDENFSTPGLTPSRSPAPAPPRFALDSHPSPVGTPVPSARTLPSPVHKAKHLPKKLSDNWIYRNGPGFSRRLPMLGPTVDEDSRRNRSSAASLYEDDRKTLYARQTRPSSVRSLAVPDSFSQRSAGSESKQHSPDTFTVRRENVDEDTRSVSSLATVASPHTHMTPAEVVRMEAQLGVARVPSTSGAPDAENDVASHQHTTQWITNLHQQQQQNASPAYDTWDGRLSSTSSDHTPSIMSTRPQGSNWSTVSTSFPRSPSPQHSTACPMLAAPRATYATTQATPMLRPPSRTRRTPADYVFGDVLGEGSYSTVIKAWDIHDLPEKERHLMVHQSSALAAAAGQTTNALPSRAYAVKVLDKVHILKEKKQKYVRVEKEALSLLLHCPGVVTLYHTFQDRESLYFVLELAPNGELLQHVQALGSLDITSATFYAAQLADALDGIHRAGVIHRDIKPENVLLDEHMRIRVTDFGSARIVPRGGDEQAEERTGSFVGTAEYVSPELLAEKAVGMPSDWWAFGCVLFQLLVGHSPFKAANEYQTFQRVIHRSFAFPDGFPRAARILIDSLLSLDPLMRPRAVQVKSSMFFANTNFATLWTVTPPPLQPGLYGRSQAHRTLQQGLADLEASFEAVSVSDASQERSYSAITGDDEESTDEDAARTHSSATKDAANSQNDMTYSDLLAPNEDVMFSSPMILKRTGAGSMFSKRCQLLLTTYPRLLCVREHGQMIRVLVDIALRNPSPTASAPTSTAQPGLKRSDSRRSTQSRRERSLRNQPSLASIGLPSLKRGFSWRQTREDDTYAENSEEVRDIPCVLLDVEVRGSKGFVVQTTTRSFMFEDPSSEPQYWVQCIREVQQNA